MSLPDTTTFEQSYNTNSDQNPPPPPPAYQPPPSSLQSNNTATQQYNKQHTQILKQDQTGVEADIDSEC